MTDAARQLDSSGRIRRLAAWDASPLAAGIIAALVFCFALASLALLEDPFDRQSYYFLDPASSWSYYTHRLHHGRPMEISDAFVQAAAKIRLDLKDELGSSSKDFTDSLRESRLSAPAALAKKLAANLRAYLGAERELAALIDRDPGDWRRNHNAGYLMQAFSTEVPFVWLYEKTGLTCLALDIAMSVFLALGAACLFLSAREASRSNAAGLAAVVLLYLLTPWPASGSSQGGILVRFLCIFPCLFLAQLAAQEAPRRGLAASVRRAAGFCLLLAVFTVCAVATGMVFPPQHRVIPILSAGVVFLLGIVQRSKTIALRGLLLGAAVALAVMPMQRLATRDFAPAAGVNLAANEGFAEAAIFFGIFERPNHYSIPHSDFVLSMPQEAYDRILGAVQSDFIPIQTFGAFGKDFFTDMILARPLFYLETLAKRTWNHLARHRELAFSLYPQSGFSWLLAYWWLGLACLALALLSGLAQPQVLAAVMPLALGIVWEYAGMGIIFVMAHGHDQYISGGIFFLWCLTPALAVTAAKGWPLIAAFVFRLGRRLPELTKGTRKIWLATGAGVVLLLTPLVTRGIEKERIIFDNYHLMYVDVFKGPGGQSPEELDGRVRALQFLGGEEPGVVEMYGAWLFFLMEQWRYHPGWPSFNVKHVDRATLDAWYARAKEIKLAYYRRALAAAPDNSYLPVYAQWLGDPDFVEIFRRAVSKDPKGPFAAYMISHVLAQSAVSGRERLEFEQIAVDRIGELLGRTVKYRPGFRRVPGLAKPVDHPAVAGSLGLSVRLKPGEKAVISGIATAGSEELKVCAFVKVESGQVQGTLESADQTVRAPLSPVIGGDASGRYLTARATGLPPQDDARLVFEAGPEGALFIVRDVYPLVIQPRRLDKRPAAKGGLAP